jgi:hypothetical protein
VLFIVSFDPVDRARTGEVSPIRTWIHIHRKYVWLSAGRTSHEKIACIDEEGVRDGRYRLDKEKFVSFIEKWRGITYDIGSRMLCVFHFETADVVLQ